MAGVWFAINGQFINRSDNWENRAWGMLAYQTPKVDFLSDGPQHGIIDSYCSECEPVGVCINEFYLNSQEN